VCFTDPKRSKVDIVQAAGRALRLSNGKKFGYILIPIFIPAGADFNEAAEEQGFDDVAITVRALATTDQRIVEYLRVISSGGTHRGGTPVDGLTSANSLLKIEAEEFDKAIKLKVWDKVATSNWQSYEDAKKYTSKLNLKSQRQWYEYLETNNKPLDIPRSPEGFYKRQKTWISWGDFLGTNSIATYNRKYVSFDECKKFAKKNKIINVVQWKNLVNIPSNITKSPHKTYKKEWKGWGDFFGTNRRRSNKSKFLNYKDAKKYISKLNLKSLRQWFKYKNTEKFPDFLPKYPSDFYKNSGWNSWNDFLSYTGRRFKTLEEAKKIVKSNNFQNLQQWKEFIIKKKLTNDFPLAVDLYYKKNSKNWKGTSDFLNFPKRGTLKKKYISFNKAKLFAQSKRITSTKEWKDYVKSKGLPDNMSSNPQGIYKQRWKGWGDFLGTGRIADQLKVFYGFKKSKSIVSKLKLNNKNQFHILRKTKKISVKIPYNPDKTYKRSKEWKGWPDFLGKKK